MTHCRASPSRHTPDLIEEDHKQFSPGSLSNWAHDVLDGRRPGEVGLGNDHYGLKRPGDAMHKQASNYSSYLLQRTRLSVNTTKIMGFGREWEEKCTHRIFKKVPKPLVRMHVVSCLNIYCPILPTYYCLPVHFTWL